MTKVPRGFRNAQGVNPDSRDRFRHLVNQRFPKATVDFELDSDTRRGVVRVSVPKDDGRIRLGTRWPLEAEPAAIIERIASQSILSPLREVES